MCATGLPDPQKDHAVRMVRFARDCLFELGHILTNLVDELGDDTVQLRMRVGIHSGSTTGGVLRGKKGRFQLFGDTVNCASRMESTSMPGKIQISQATANALKAYGKEAWITPREDRVEAKGKGFLQTYWVNVQVDSSAQTSHSLRDAMSDGPGDPLEDPGEAASAGYNSHFLRAVEEDEICDGDHDASMASSQREEILLENQLHDYLNRRGNSNSTSDGP